MLLQKNSARMSSNEPLSANSCRYFRVTLSDTLEWNVENGKIVVLSMQKNFLKFRNAVKTGGGDIENDIKLSIKRRIEKY